MAGLASVEMSTVLARGRRWLAVLSMGVATTLVVSVAPGAPALAARPVPATVAAQPSQRSTPVSPVAAKSTTPAPMPAAVRAEPAWPAAGSAVVDVPAAGSARARAAGLPVWLGRPASAGARSPGDLRAAVAGPAPGGVRVDLADRAAAQRAGVAGLLLAVSRADGGAVSGSVSLEVDYSGFRDAFGADWAARLSVVRLPGCPFSAPDAARCANRELVPTRNDAVAGRLTADVAVAPTVDAGDDPGFARQTGEAAQAQPTVFAVTALSSGPDGPDFARSPLASAVSWQAGTQAGDFSTSYPVRVPPAPAGPAPSVSLGYASGSVDGRTNAMGAQTSWLGEGWGFEPGYVERSYRPCEQDAFWSKELRLVVGTGTGGVGSWGVVIPSLDLNSTVVGADDFTGDGKADLLHRDEEDMSLRLTTGNGVGGFADFSTTVGTGWGPVSFLATPGDWTGDGKPDVIYRRDDTTHLYVLAGNGAGGWGNNYQLGSYWHTADAIMSPGDWSGDGKPDVIYRRASDHLLFMVRGNGIGGWATGVSEQIGGDWSAASVIFGRGDFSGDGKPDLLYRHVSGANIYMIRGNGAGGWATGVSELVAVGWADTENLTVAEATGDGKRDILAVGRTPMTPYYLNKTGDLCWRADNATLVLGGRSVELILDDVTGAWRPQHDDGSKVQRQTGAGNYDNDGEHWKLTTPDGVQYFFGLNRLPGWTIGKPETGSAWDVPVFANHAGEPCFNPSAGFAGSWCRQAWRWNLDYVTDPHGNSMSYWYTKELNGTGLAGNPNATAWYDRGGHLNRIDYGTRLSGGVDSGFTGPAPAQVAFTLADRCLASCGTLTNFPDTPWDLHCTAVPCSNNLAPSFWTSKRLASITTRVWGGSAYRDVEAWTLTHTFPDPTDGTDPSLWLASIAHTGLVFGSLAMPTVSFDGVAYANRLDTAFAPPANKYRVTSVFTGTGGQIAIGYQGTDCTVATLPSPDNNPKRCFPQIYLPPGGGTPYWAWWNKYRVTSVTEVDQVGGSPNVTHSYGYSTAGSSTAVLWHDDNNVWAARRAKRSYSMWRGYNTVTVTTGPAGGTRSHTEYLYMRGMHGDLTNAGIGTRVAQVTASEGAVINDDNLLAGFLREQRHYSAPGGTLLAATLYDPWQQQTAQRVESITLLYPPSQHGGYLRTGRTQTRTWLAGSSSWRRTDTQTTFETTHGQPTAVKDFGDVGTSTDDVCTAMTYARNITAWLIDYPASQTITTCAGSPAGSDYLGGTRTYYDHSTILGADPSRGLPTKTEVLATATGAAGSVTLTYAQSGRADHDALARPTKSWDAIDRLTTMAYTPAGGGPVTAMTVTNPAGHSSSTILEPAWGLPLTATDPNTKTTTGGYDPLGRLTKVWLPGRATNLTPNTEYLYNLRTAAPSSITSKTLGPAGQQILAHDIYDGLLRLRQTQTTAPDGKRVIADTSYDSRGLAAKQSRFYNNASGPTDTLVTFTDTSVESQTQHVYDGLGRQTTAILMSLGVERWRTSYARDGDRVSVTPPAGGTAAATLRDARGRTTALWQFTAAGTPTGAYQATTYSYDRLGHLTKVTDPVGNDWDYVYDLRGRKTSTADPDAGSSSMSYDNAGQLLTATDARGVTLAYAYDSLGRRTQTWKTAVGTGTKLAEWAYDTLAKGHLDSATRWSGGQPYKTEITGYDDGYRPLGTTVTIPAAETGLAGSYTFAATYNVDGSPATQTLPALGGLAAETLTHGYNPSTGLPNSLTGAASYVNSTSYHWDGQVYQQIRGPAGRQVRHTHSVQTGTRRETVTQVDTEHQSTPGTWVDRATTEYGYSNAGTITALAGKTNGIRDQVECFSYDRLQRLTEAWSNATWDCAAGPQATGVDPYWLTWTYDTTGNRLTQVDHTTVGGNTTVTYTPGTTKPHTLASTSTTGPGGSSTAGYGYDPAGNTTSRPGPTGQQTLTWTDQGNLATVTEGGQVTEYLYDADGNRLLRRDPAGKTLNLPGGSELRYTTAGGTTAGTRYYNHGNSTIAVRTPGGLTWLHVDHHGTAALATNATDLTVQRRRSKPFGGPAARYPAAGPATRASSAAPPTPPA